MVFTDGPLAIFSFSIKQRCIIPSIFVFVLLQVVTNPYDRTKIKLLFINKTENDIMLREELDRLAMEYPETLEVTHVIS